MRPNRTRPTSCRDARARARLTVRLALALTTLGLLRPAAAEDGRRYGARLFARYCASCHGADGDGRGPAAQALQPKPRDFRRGLFKYQSTPAGALPTEGDLERTLVAGVPGTAMPSFASLPPGERRALARHVLALARSVQDRPAPAARPITLPPAPADLGAASRVKLGRTLFSAYECEHCHGETGAGDGIASRDMYDEWGEPARPTNFQAGVLGGGRTPRDIYRSIAVGISGTPMPAFASMITSDRIWSLVAYLRVLMANAGDPDEDDAFDECVVFGNCIPAFDARPEPVPPFVSGTD